MLNRIAIAMVAIAVLQPTGAADLAAKMSGRWVLNTSLSDPQGSRGGRRGGGAAFALAPGGQRGARGGSGEPAPQMPSLTRDEAAAQQALSDLQQVPPEMTVEASATQVKFIDPRGDAVFQIDGKNTAVNVPGGSIKVRSRWDRAELRQEFSSTQRVLRRTWSVDANGRLTLKQRLEGIGISGKETQAVFDRQ